MRERGIYRKIVSLYPAYCKKVDPGDYFFRIYPGLYLEQNIMYVPDTLEGLFLSTFFNICFYAQILQ